MELSKNLKKYIFLHKKQEDASEIEKEDIFSMLEEIYYTLDDEEIDYLELKGFI